MSDSESSSSALKDSKNIIVDHEVNLRNVLENEQRQCIYHLNSFNDGDDFIPDDRSTPVHRSGEASSSQLPVDNVEVLEEHISKMKQLANTEDSPVKPGVDGRNVKSFEELLELSIKNDSLAVASVNSPTKKQVVKRPFLKKGAGIEARFKPKKLMKRSCQKEKTSIESNVGGHANAQTCSKPMNTKIVNVLPRTNTSAPVAKKSTSVIGNPLSFKKPIALHQTKGSNAPDTSLDNLERLLLSVKIKKEELWCQPCSSPSSSEDGSCWEDEEDIDTSEEPKNQSKKKVRWNDCQPHMSKAKVGVYSKSVQNYMASLEEKLFELQERCASKVEKKVKQKPKSAEISVEIANEIADLRSQIAVIADGIKTLQLYTSNLRANDKAKKRSLDSLGKVRITRELPIREPVKGIPKVPSPCHGEDTTVQFGNGDRMQVLNDGTVVRSISFTSPSMINYIAFVDLHIF